MDIRYLAGLVDGEGCIALSRPSHRCSMQLTLCIAMCHRPIIELLTAQYGGDFRVRERTGNRRRQFTWLCHGERALNLVKEMLPYLIVKKEEALLVIQAIEYRKSLPRGGGRGGGSPRTEEQRAKLMWYADECSRLKKIEYQG